MGDTARHLTAVFKLLDFDSSGYIEEVEGMRIGKTLGYQPVFEYWEELKKLDTDGDGKISLQEFLKGNEGMDAKKAVQLKETLEGKLANLAAQNGGTTRLASIRRTTRATRKRRRRRGSRIGSRSRCGTSMEAWSWSRPSAILWST